MLVDVRYHLSSLVAVFLSLGLGIVIGMSLAEDDTLRREQQNLIRSIQLQVAAVQERNSQLEDELDRLFQSVGEYEARLFEMGRRHFGAVLRDLSLGVIGVGSTGSETVFEMLREYGLAARHVTWPSLAAGAEKSVSDFDPFLAGDEILLHLLGEADEAAVERLQAWGLMLSPLEEGSADAGGAAPVQVLVVVAHRPEEGLLPLVERAAERGIPTVFALPAGAKAAEWDGWLRWGGVVVEGVEGLVGRLNLLQAIAEFRGAEADGASSLRPVEAGSAE